MSLKERTIVGVVWSLVQRWAARFWGLLVFFILARLLGPEAFGLVAYAGVFIAIADIFLGNGFVKALVQRPKLEPEHLDTAFWSNIVTGALLTALVFALAPLIAHLSNQPELGAILRWLSLVFIINAFVNVQNAYLQRELAYRALAVRTLLGLVVGGAVGVGMAFAGFGVWSLVAQQLISSVLSTATLWFLSSWRPRFAFSRKHFVDLFAFEVNSFGTRALTFINRRSDDLLIGAFLGPTALGFYGVAYRAYYIVAELFSSSFSEVAFSAISRTQTELARTRRAFYSLIETVSFLAFPAFIGLAFVAPLLVPLVFGEEWTKSVLVLQILCGAGMIQTSLSFNFVVVQAYGKPQWQVAYGALSAVINLVSFLSVVRFGIEAVAAAYTIRAYILSPVSVIMVKRLTNISIKDYLRRFLGPLTASLLMVGALYATLTLSANLAPAVRLALLALAGGTSYLASIRLIAPALSLRVFDLVRTTLPLRRPLKAKG